MLNLTLLRRLRPPLYLLPSLVPLSAAQYAISLHNYPPSIFFCSVSLPFPYFRHTIKAISIADECIGSEYIS